MIGGFCASTNGLARPKLAVGSSCVFMVLLVLLLLLLPLGLNVALALSAGIHNVAAVVINGNAIQID